MTDTGWFGRADRLHVDEVDGVRVVWADVPGPVAGGVTFRVGHADEAFLEAGVTHLVEHLALFGLARPGDHTNGAVHPTVTALHTTGSPEDVADFLDAVTRQVRDLPTQRLDAERDVLRAEDATRGGGALAALTAWRYGCTPWANAAGSPVALHRLDAERAQEWARERMSRANAVVFLSCPPPPGLRLHLPEPPSGGGRFPEPATDPRVSVLPVLPAWVPGDDEGAALHTLLPRGPASGVLERLYAIRLVEELRTQRAAAYSPSVKVQVITGRISLLTVGTDLLREQASEAAPRVAGILAEIASAAGQAAPVGDEEVARAKAALRREDDDPQAALGTVTAAAFALLTNTEVLDGAAQRARLDAVTAADVARAAREALTSAIALLPRAAGPATGWAQAPECVEPPLAGEGARPLQADDDRTLIVTASAAGTRGADGSWVTIPRDRTAAVRCWPDGRRELFGLDASRLAVEPTLWRDGPELVALIDRAWPAEVMVEMPARAPDQIPHPDPTAGRPAPEAAGQAAARRLVGRLVDLMLGLLARLSSGSRRVGPGSHFSTGRRGPHDHLHLEPPRVRYPD